MPTLLNPMQFRLTQRVQWDDEKGGDGGLRIIYPDILNKDIFPANRQTDEQIVPKNLEAIFSISSIITSPQELSPV